jgi:O-methyltransferase
LKLLITSISVKANINNETTDILIVTSPKFQPLIQKEVESFDLKLLYYTLDLHTLFEAGCSRLNIFKYENIHKYDTILYLDTDILLNSDVNILFELELSSHKIYALEEGIIDNVCWGSQFFDFTIYNKETSAFTSGILLFKNSDCMKLLFDTINSHIIDYIYTKHNAIPQCLDQPFIVYHAITQNKYDNQLLKNYVENNPSTVSLEKIIYHFPGGPGVYDSKISKMTFFWTKMECFMVDTILQNHLTLVSKERLENVFKQCRKYRNKGYSFVECGVAKGGCLAMMKYASGNNKIFGFDSFEGMPDITEEDIDSYNKSCPKSWVGVPLCTGVNDVHNTFEKLNINMNNVTLVKGYFKDTLNISKNIEEIGDIGVLRLDGDWYESTMICLERLYDKVVIGGTIIIDDYGYFIGAKRATDEFRLKNNITSPLIQTDDTEHYWIKSESKDIKKYVIQVGAHIGNTENDMLFKNINNKLTYILIEPVPHVYHILKQNYKNYTNVICINIAVSNKIGEIELYIPSQNNDFNSLVPWASQLASTNPDHIHTFVPNCIVEKISVQCTTLNKLIEDYNIQYIDTIITDTEGHDYDILMDLNLSTKPDHIIFENKHMDGPKHQIDIDNAPKYHELLNHFKLHGYDIEKQTAEDTFLKYLKTVNIHEDIWTCSDEMRLHIADFFKDKSHFKIAEIGAHKGYTTKVLSYLFSKVYAVDNSVEWTAFNKNYNNNRTNIEYVMLDIYNDNWNILPSDIDVVFIDAGHSYEQCKSDVIHSINQFTNLKYIIFDDYGVWEGVKKVIDEMIGNHTLLFERFIGLTNVPGPSGIVNNTNEGIICRVNTNKEYHILDNKTYLWQNHSITFLKNGLMNAFGPGTYTQQNTYTFQANFGGRVHILAFNDNYTEFTSTRKGDGEIVKGKLI